MPKLSIQLIIFLSYLLNLLRIIKKSENTHSISVLTFCHSFIKVKAEWNESHILNFICHYLAWLLWPTTTIKIVKLSTICKSSVMPPFWWNRHFHTTYTDYCFSSLLRPGPPTSPPIWFHDPFCISLEKK